MNEEVIKYVTGIESHEEYMRMMAREAVHV